MFNKLKDKTLMISNIIFIFIIIFITAWYVSLVSSLERKLETPEPETIYRYVDTNDYFDTSALSQWCGDSRLGKVRMIGAGQAEGESKGKVEDEQGNRWNVIADYEDNDTLLLWVADNHTPQDVSDDVVVKVWRES